MADNDLELDSFDFGDFDSFGSDIVTDSRPMETPSAADIVTSLKKRAMIVIFVIDVSGSMKGARIGAVNDAIRNVLSELKKRERGNTSAEIRVAMLEFSTRANWKTLVPEPVSAYKYTDIANVSGCTNYGQAFEALNKKLTRNQFLNSTAGSYTPLIIFMTDGKPSDIGLYREQLDILKMNKWFQYATRAGIAIEEGALSKECRKALLEFTGNEKNIYEAKNTVVLAKQIEMVTLAGVDFVTQQGSVQNSAVSITDDLMPFDSVSPQTHAEGVSAAVSAPAENNASPTLPVDEIDWVNDFTF